MSHPRSIELALPDADATSSIAARLAPCITPGDAMLLSGGIGAGKTHFARALIQAWLARKGLWEDVPSPTFTLVQAYSNGTDELWHADLFRLTSTMEVSELGLENALETAVTLIEWPDRLGDLRPAIALDIELLLAVDGRKLVAKGPEHLLAALECPE